MLPQKTELPLKATFHFTISLRGKRATGNIQRNNYHHGSCGPSLTVKATIARCDLSPDSFVMMPRYCANLKAIRSESRSLNRIVADKLHRVIIA